MSRATLIGAVFAAAFVAALASVEAGVSWPAGGGWPVPEVRGADDPAVNFAYLTGPSNFSACCSLPWPPQQVAGATVSLSQPGSSTRGWWNTIKFWITPTNFVMPVRNNSLSATGTCNIGSPRCCRDGAAGAWRTESCSVLGAVGDQECDLEVEAISGVGGVDDGDATCHESTIYYLENAIDTPAEADFEGINTIPTEIAIFAPGANDCTTINAQPVELMASARGIADGMLAHPGVTQVYLHVGISWIDRTKPSAPDACKNMLEQTCTTDCTHTYQDLEAEYPDGELHVLQAGFDTVRSANTPSGNWPLHELYTSDGLHVNVHGWPTEINEMIIVALGLSQEHADAGGNLPPAATLVSKTDTTVTVNLASPIVDEQGDTLTCVVWAQRTDTPWVGGYQGADRVNNAFGACRSLNAGVACPNCGDVSNGDADCTIAGTTTAATAHYWLTPADAPLVPDCTVEGVNCVPDFYSLPCDASGSATIRGLTAATEYVVLLQGWPTDPTDRAWRSTAVNDTFTVTTDP